MRQRVDRNVETIGTTRLTQPMSRDLRGTPEEISAVSIRLHVFQ